MNEEKNACPACCRKLMKWPFDHCMWCGKTLPAELRLSAEEKSVIFQKREQALKEEQAADEKLRTIGDQILEQAPTEENEASEDSEDDEDSAPKKKAVGGHS